MDMATRLIEFLAQNGVQYQTLQHPHSATSMHTAHVANIPGDKLAKPVILEDQQGYIMAVIPATEQVKIREVNRLLHRNMGLATESELRPLFSDCELGAIPPVGQAYDMETIVDASLDKCNEVYFESGNHEQLIHMEGNAFQELMKNSTHANICTH